ncbi:tetratricopeptide repeat protein [Paenibacillus sp. P96]|uniref:Tetratricopeptide repeat protein n=1 Tax=Paenibacillus zeirhizosphaerae TaxID=2987519 RepID=A0ABT9FPM0_9BACL|nr:tetratricopeptide repeat protein [Paenibacillus sp. P96]MDP4096624.1 tetratricopeptide repeat protein [Paenibacillus sp. P96]
MKAEEYVQKAYFSILSNDFEEAIRWFEQAIAAEPDNADYRFRCSITYARSNRLDQALEHAKYAVRLAPGHDDYKIHLRALEARRLAGDVRKMLSRNDSSKDQARIKAINMLREAVNLDPLCADAYVLLALVYSDLNQYDEALSAAAEAIALLPQEEQLIQLQRDLLKRKNDKGSKK